MDGLNQWYRLEEVDLRENCIEQLSHMRQLTLLRGLVELRLSDNPVCFVKQYRQTVLGCISHTVPPSFRLDDKSLNRTENRLLHRGAPGIPAYRQAVNGDELYQVRWKRRCAF